MCLLELSSLGDEQTNHGITQWQSLLKSIALIPAQRKPVTHKKSKSDLHLGVLFLLYHTIIIVYAPLAVFYSL